MNLLEGQLSLCNINDVKMMQIEGILKLAIDYTAHDPRVTHNVSGREADYCPRVGQALLQQLVKTDTGAKGTTEGKKQNRFKLKSCKIGEIKYRQNITCWNCSQKGHFQNQCSKVVASKGKEVNMAAEDSDDALKSYKGSSNALDVRYIPSLKRRLIPVGQLDEEGYQVGFGDQQWKVTKGSLVVAHGNKCESLYMVERRQGNCRDWSKFIQKAMALHLLHQSEDPATMIQLSMAATGFTKIVPETPLQFGVAKRLNQTFRAESTGICVEAPKMLWADSVSTAYLIYHIPYVLIGLHILEEEWRGKDISLTHLKAAAQMKCDTAFGIRRVTRLSKAEITFVDSIYGARSATDSSSLTKPIQKSQVVLVDIPDNLAENDSIVAEHGLSLEITLSLGGSSNTSEGSKNSGSFEDSRRSDEEDSKDGASSKEGGSKTPHVRRSNTESMALVSKESVEWKKAINEEMVSLEKNQTCSLVRISAKKKASQKLWMFKEPSYMGALNDTSTQHKSEGFHLAGQEENLECILKEILVQDMCYGPLSLLKKMKDRCSEKQVLGYVLTVSITTVEWESGLQKSITMLTIEV
ncbi:retrovirus-related pol polyprotein from transposon TNT 1-94 [Tanacetum coccineum]|uniref:Retrovirus-related pol polyprotein from transposon TNT 1-94 n=1 Tax=Tanacetum coccineum TaxID=301880 RepID=A0ABQ5B5Y8_9ASTR